MGSNSEKPYVGSYDDQVVLNQQDRITNLPSCIIGSHILSLLPTKEAVATSVLSKRWKYLWTLITCPDFVDDDDKTVARQNNFTSFVYHVLQLTSSSSLRSFRLKCTKIYDSSHVIAWVSTVLRRNSNVECLDISVPVEQMVQLPWNLFDCGTLVELKLGRGFVLSLPSTSVCRLPCLKVLSLDKIKFLDEGSIARLIDGCPALEELALARCIGKDVKVINIRSPVLTQLYLTSLSYNLETNISKINVVLETPKLSYLCVHDSVAQGYKFMDLSRLRKASIDMRYELGDDMTYRGSLTGLLVGISGVNSLELGGRILEALVYPRCQLPVLFRNVSELKLEYSSMSSLGWLFSTLLKKMPCLTILTLTIGYDGVGNICWRSHDVPDCLLRSLRKIEIMSFRGRDSERDLVKYFLNNAKVLEKLIIHHDDDFTKTLWASSICKIEHL